MTKLINILRKIGIALRLISTAVESTKAVAEDIKTKKS